MRTSGATVGPSGSPLSRIDGSSKRSPARRFLHATVQLPEASGGACTTACARRPRSARRRRRCGGRCRSPQAPRNQRQKPSLPSCTSSRGTAARRRPAPARSRAPSCCGTPLTNTSNGGRTFGGAARASGPSRAPRRVPCPRWRRPSPFDYRVRRSDRARRVRVRVDPEHGVEVVLPRRAAEREAAAAIRELRPWIERRIAELQRTRAASRRAARPSRTSAPRSRSRAEPGRTRVHRRGETLLVPGGEEDHRPALERWYRRQARAEIAPRLDARPRRARHRLRAA